MAKSSAPLKYRTLQVIDWVLDNADYLEVGKEVFVQALQRRRGRFHPDRDRITLDPSAKLITSHLRRVSFSIRTIASLISSSERAIPSTL